LPDDLFGPAWFSKGCGLRRLAIMPIVCGRGSSGFWATSAG
jgi:hypothetical protein